MKLVLTGATGFVGVPLVKLLLARGDAVTVLCRDEARAKATLGAGVTAVAADLETPGAWGAALAGTDAVIHLAGESVAGKRWDARQKQVIRDSRIEATRGLVDAIGALPVADRPRVLVSASGVDYYAYAGGPGTFDDDDEVTEKEPPSDSFLGRVCRDWEKEAAGAEVHGVRVARLRIGLVIGPGGGPLAEMAKPFRNFVGGKIGNGAQWMSWVHLDDLHAVILAALADDRYTGAFNIVAPDSVRNADLTRELGEALHRPYFLRAPGFALRLALGEFAEVVLHGRRVVPARLKQLGFTWKYPELRPALESALS